MFGASVVRPAFCESWYRNKIKGTSFWCKKRRGLRPRLPVSMIKLFKWNHSLKRLHVACRDRMRHSPAADCVDARPGAIVCEGLAACDQFNQFQNDPADCGKDEKDNPKRAHDLQHEANQAALK